MNTRRRIGTASACLMLTWFSMCLPQARQLPKKSETNRQASFLQQLKLYEETSYVTKAVLKNGLTVLVNEYRAQPVVSIQAHIRAGISNEPSSSPGVARLLPAMLYRSTQDKSAGTPRERAHALGGLLRSSVEYDSSQLEIVAPSSQWKKALELLIDAVSNPSFDPEELKLQGDLLKSEARKILDNPAIFAGERLLELGFDRPLMAKWSNTSAIDLRNLTCDSLTSFHKVSYVPERMMLVIAGDVSAGEVLKQVVQMYGKANLSDAKMTPPALEYAQNRFRYRETRGGAGSSQVLFGFHTGSQNSEDYPTLEVLSAILGLGDGSILATRLRDQKQIILAADVRLLTFSGTGYLTIKTEVNPKDIDRSEIAVLTELELLKRQPPDPPEIERASAQLERAYWNQLETVTGRGRMLAHFESMGDWKQMERWVTRLRQVRASDIQRLAGKYLRLENCSLVEYLPVSKGERNVSSDGIRNTLESLLKAATDQEQAMREKETTPAVKSPQNSSFKFSEVRFPFQIASILRGPDLFIREDHTAPLIHMGIFFPGGKIFETKQNAGITQLMMRTMLRGTKEKNAGQFYRQLEIYGGQLKPLVAEDYFGFYFSILSGNFDAGFNLLAEAVKSPGFDKAEVERQKGIQMSEIRSPWDSTEYPMKLVNEALFKDFAYSQNVNGTESSLSGIGQEALLSWYETFVKNKKPLVAIIGDSKGTSLASYFVQHFSGSRIQSVSVPDKTAEPLDAGESIEQIWNRGYSAVLVGFQTPPQDNEDSYALTVLQSYAGGMGRFPQELGDRKGLAFGVSLKYTPLLRGGSAIASAETSPGLEDATLKALQEEIRRMLSNSIPYRDYRAGINAAVGAYWIRSQSRLSQITDVAENIMVGKSIEDYLNLPTRLQAMKQEDLDAAAQKVFVMDKAIVLRLKGQKSAD